VFVDALPLTKVGKVDYRSLERRHAEEAQMRGGT
jgi:non-ribosomal peptide synthetase component E (peptide arylation enzyme)